MIPHTLQVTLSIAVICYFIIILYYLKRKMLELKYTLIWLVAGSHGDHDLFSGTDGVVCSSDRDAGQYEWTLYHVSCFYDDDFDDFDFNRFQTAVEDQDFDTGDQHAGEKN